MYLKENRHVALHVACGDITDVSIENGNLIIRTPDKTVLSLLEDGKRELERALSWQGREMKVVMEEKIIKPSKVDEDEVMLRKEFGEKFKVKE